MAMLLLRVIFVRNFAPLLGVAHGHVHKRVDQKRESPGLTGRFQFCLLALRSMQIPPRGVEQSANLPGKQQSGNGSGAESGALGAEMPAKAPPTDPDLQTIADAWPTLPAALKAGIVAMVKAAQAANNG